MIKTMLLIYISVCIVVTYGYYNVFGIWGVLFFLTILYLIRKKCPIKYKRGGDINE